MARFVEELSWLLTSYSDLDFQGLAGISSNIISSNKKIEYNNVSEKSEPVKLLVGVLPNFLIQTEFFPSNEDVVDFAQSALGITITRWQKRSRYELIGNIVVHTNEASPEKVNNLMKVLDMVLNDRVHVKARLRQVKDSGRSWNEVIQSILSEGY